MPARLQGNGHVEIYLNGQAPTFEVQNTHARLNDYNKNFNGLGATVCTFVPNTHRFVFGRLALKKIGARA